MSGQITTPKVKGVADIVFLIDATASMQGTIDAVKKNVANFVSTMTKTDPNGGSTVKDWRAKIVGYRDCGYDQDHYHDNPFVSSVADLERQLSALRAHGGGDEPESLLEALYKIAAMPSDPERTPDSWRPTNAARRFVVVFTDAGFHEPLAEPAGATIDDVILNMMSAKLVLHIFTPGRCNRFNVLAECDKAQWHAIGSEGLAAYTADYNKFGKIIEQLSRTITIEAGVPLVLSATEDHPLF